MSYVTGSCKPITTDPKQRTIARVTEEAYKLASGARASGCMQNCNKPRLFHPQLSSFKVRFLTLTNDGVLKSQPCYFIKLVIKASWMAWPQVQPGVCLTFQHDDPRKTDIFCVSEFLQPFYYPINAQKKVTKTNFEEISFFVHCF